MNRPEWADSADPDRMLAALGGKVSDQLRRQFAAACCRRIRDLMADDRSRGAVAVAERYADGRATADELAAARRAADEAQADARYALWGAEADANFCFTADYCAAHARLEAACAARAAVSEAAADPDGGWECYKYPAVEGDPFWFGKLRLESHACAARAVAEMARSAVYAAAEAGRPVSPDAPSAAYEAALTAEGKWQAELLRALLGNPAGAE